MINQTEHLQASSPAAQWLQQHGDVLYGYAMARLRDPVAAEDLVQETLLAAIDAQSRFAGDSSRRTWLVGILRNKLFEYYRSKRRDTAHSPDSLEVIVNREFTEKGRWVHGPASWPATLDTEPQRREFRIALEECLTKLPGVSAEAFLLAERDGMSAENVRNALGISSTNHVYVMLHRARSALRQCLERNWVGSSD